MRDALKPDICVVGAGAAGLSMVAILRQFGASTVLVEAGAMGGECLNRGCVPSKALLAAAARAQAFRDAGAFGIAPAEPGVDFAEVMRRVRTVIATIAPNDSAERFAALGAIVIKGRARFTDARTLLAGDAVIRPRRVVLAVGSRPKLPAIPGLADTPHITTDGVFDLARQPRRLIILGAGASGLELAQAFRRLGSAVTVIEAGRALAHEDPELALAALTALRREGVEIREHVFPRRAEPWHGGVRLVLARPDAPEEDGEIIEADLILAAAGREPAIADLGLEAAGIKADARGIIVDAGLRSSNRRVYAIGDCAGGPFSGLRLTNIANDQAAVVARRLLFRLPAKVDYAAIPSVVYTDPELASVGLTEAAARDRVSHLRILRWPFSENDRAQTENATQGHVKLVVDRGGKILGAGIVGHGAGELIAPWALAVREGLNISSFRDLVLPYPTFSEASRRAALGYYAGIAERRPLRAFLRLVRFLG